MKQVKINNRSLNMNKILFLAFLLFTFCSIELFSNNIKILGYDEENIGIVENNKIKFYKYGDTNKWEEMSFMEFNVPIGYQDIFAIFGSDNRFFTGIIIKNKLKIYFFEENNWIEDSEWGSASLNLFKNFNKVFTIQFGNPVLAVVTNNKIKTIEFINGAWKENKKKEFIIPNGYQDVIAGNNEYNLGGFGIVFNDRIQFYWTSDDLEWSEAEEIRFYLPSGNKKIIGLGFNIFGIIDKNKIIIYKYEYYVGWKKSDIEFEIR
jgi:ribosomal protein L32E